MLKTLWPIYWFVTNPIVPTKVTFFEFNHCLNFLCQKFWFSEFTNIHTQWWKTEKKVQAMVEFEKWNKQSLPKQGFYLQFFCVNFTFSYFWGMILSYLELFCGWLTISIAFRLYVGKYAHLQIKTSCNSAMSNKIYKSYSWFFDLNSIGSLTLCPSALD